MSAAAMYLAMVLTNWVHSQHAFTHSAQQLTRCTLVQGEEEEFPHVCTCVQGSFDSSQTYSLSKTSMWSVERVCICVDANIETNVCVLVVCAFLYIVYK